MTKKQKNKNPNLREAIGELGERERHTERRRKMRKWRKKNSLGSYISVRL